MIAPIIGKLQKSLDKIGLFDRIGGIVETQMQGKKQFPVCVEKNCILKGESCTDAYISFVPNSQDLAMCYFEHVSNANFNNVSRLARLKLVCYWNVAKVETAVHDVITHIAQAIEGVNGKMSDTICINGNCRVVNFSKDAAVFQKYTYNDSDAQFTKYPFEFCVFDLEFTYRIDYQKLKPIVLKVE